MIKKRVDYFDLAKGLGILAIIAGHLGNDAINRFVFTFHVPLFFVISGFFMKQSDTKSLIKKKADQLIKPYIVSCIAVCIGSVVVNTFTEASRRSELVEWLVASLYGAGDSWEFPFHIRQIGAIWFLLALFWGILIANGCLKRPKTGMILVAACAYLGIATADIVWLPWSIQAGCVAAVYILLGYGAGKIGLFDEKPGLPVIIGSGLVWFWSIWKFKGFWLVHNYFGNGILDFLGSICAIYLVILISKWLDGHTKFIRKLLLFYGKNSLWVLGFHVFELNLFPWWHINVLCDSSGINSSGQLVVLFVLKVLFATAGVIVLKRLTAFWKRKNSVAC